MVPSGPAQLLRCRIRIGLGWIRRLAIKLLLAGAALVGLAGVRGQAQDVIGMFVPIEVPGARFTAARAITADGRIVGFFIDSGGRTHGFLLADGTFETLDVSGARATIVAGMNARGDAVGQFSDDHRPTGRSQGRRARAFRRDRHGDYESFDAPTSPASDTRAFGINAAGDIIGRYTHSGVTRGFVLNRRETP
jgi:probable HAF family extracellular repeat protein